MNCPRCDTPLPENSRYCLACGTNISGDTGAGTPVPIEMGPDVEQAVRTELAGMYEVERELGRGGMGAVFLATEKQLGRRVAIKVLPPAFAFGQGSTERFKREARTAATLDHPHVIPIYRVSEKDTLLWYAMKYVEGETLSELMDREGLLGFERAADIIAQAAEALLYAHQRGVIHRDVKPGNIMIDGRGWVVVTDFGIAKATGTVSITGSGSMLGTPYYMSPEQCSGKNLAPASDQYSLGVLAYQMLSGVVPFSGDSVVDVVKQHCFDPVPPLRDRRPDCPPALAAVIERSLAKDPAERFGSVKEFADAFGAAARGEVTDPAAVSPRGGLPRPSEVAAGLAVRRRRVLAAVFAVLAVGGVFALRAVRRPRAAQSPLQPAAGMVPRESVGAPAAAPAPAAGTGRLTLDGVPAGAAVTANGRRVSGDSIALEPGVRTTVRVVAAGFEPWTFTITPQGGERLTRRVVLRQLADTSAAAAPSAAANTGFLTVGSRPTGQLFINDRPAPSNPVTRYAVPAGIVRLRFVVTDSTGTWSRDTSVAVGPGEDRRIGYVRLVRP